MPVEPVSITLAAIALLEPAVKGCIEAYGVYKLTKEFGHDFCEYSRKYDAQRARLEEWYNWPFYYTGTPTRSDQFIRAIDEELGAMRTNFQLCSNIILKFSQPCKWSQHLDLHTQRLIKVAISATPMTTISPASTEHLNPTKKMLHNLFHRKKSTRSASGTSVSSELSLASASSGLVACTPSTPASSLSTSGPSDNAAATAAADRQDTVAKNRQGNATMGNKIKWLTERKTFLRAVNSLIASNDLVESLIRARVSRPKPEPVDVTSSANLPEELLTTQVSLQRLHHALKAANKADTGRLEFGVNLVSKHSLTAEDVKAGYHEVRLRENSLVFRLQVHKPREDQCSRLLLAESLCGIPVAEMEPAEQDHSTTNTIDLVPLDLAGDNAFAPIRHVTTPGYPLDRHHLFQDVSANWARTSSLAELFNEEAPDRPSRYSLAAILALSHILFTPDKLPVNTSHAEDYCYYDCSSNEEFHQSNEKTAIIRDQDRLLSPYLVSTFGSPPHKIPTRAFGGARGATPVYNSQIVDLGLLIYQIGRWQPLKHATSNSIRDELRTVAREHMHDLHRETGMGFAETVRLCLDWKYTAQKDQLADQVLLYEKVVETLRELDEAIRIRPYELG